jgi:hypothetical protein
VRRHGHLLICRVKAPGRGAWALLQTKPRMAGLGHHDDDRLVEISLNADPGGTAIDDAARDSAVVASIALQHGVDADTLRPALMRSGNGVASGPLGGLLDLLASVA